MDKWSPLKDHHARVADRAILSLFQADPGRAATGAWLAVGEELPRQAVSRAAPSTEAAQARALRAENLSKITGIPCCP